ncbi:hypothetical protein VSY18_22770 [Bacillus albus]|uniref:hypothetical protein n=1 Tax=Bacillus TaxID=1386 RepID=UPI0020018CFF|nr:MULTISPECIES: hypothetical protein [Bacillus]MDA2025015.1 hypothetical protein [Bacillus cereus group sp. Bcc03]MDA2214760.1 hypothetical protein [Bacillus cereus group sp. Bc228]MDA2226716.1 hypothetical protein [Bacillus cereus group sp. Bc227]MDA2259087.1 hypothetical protein [Bacillus cereus group sp. Bc200]MDA2325071.1 hypothetical protein [Bacillus cereus group sp. Bc177]
MFDGLTIETIGKFAPVFTTIIATLLIPAVLYSVNQLVIAATTKEIDKLYLNKATQVKLNFWNVILSTLLGAILYLFAAVFFNFGVYDNLNKTWSNSEKVWYIGGTLIISVILLVVLYFLFLFSLHKNKKFNIILKVLISLQIISSVIIFSYLITIQIFRKWNYEMIPSIVLLILIFACIQTTMNNLTRNKKPSQYIITIVAEEKLETLIHGYTLDEKRTVCFAEGIKPDEVFYVCDFSSKVFLKHTKKSEEHVTANPATSANNTPNC